jgi:LysR family transcriptional regulator of abg operon
VKLSQFRDLVAVAEAGSLRAAARHLDIAQPVITRSIRELEHELGVPLFERHAKGVRLTQAGEMFVERVRSFQHELRRGREELAQTFQGGTGGEVSVALSIASCMGLLPRAIGSFYRRYPQALLKISESLFQPVEQEIAQGTIDFWIGPFDQSSASPQFAVERLFDNRRRVVARRGHPLAGARSLRELVSARWVRPTLSTRSTEGDFDEMFERAGLPPPNIAIHARSSLVTVLSVASTDFLTVLPQQWLEFDAMAQLVQPLDLIEPTAAAPMCIVRRQGLPLTPMAEHLCDLLRKAALNYARENPD